MISPEEKFIEVFKEPFSVPDVATLWPEIKKAYDDCGFLFPLKESDGQVLSDDAMVSEFSWVYSQYSKYIGTRYGHVKDGWRDIDAVLTYINEQIAKANTVPKDRKTLVYQRMKIVWLLGLRGYMEWMKDYDGEEDYAE